MTLKDHPRLISKDHQIINSIMQTAIIQNRIHEIRGQKVILDFDLANIYEIETRIMNQAVKRNARRFPEDFMFQLTEGEFISISSQIVTRYPAKRPKTALPYAFTEHGVTMLASILRTNKAVEMNIAVVRAFIALRKIAHQRNDITAKLEQLSSRIDEHDIQLKAIYDAIENLLDEQSEQKTWEERERIGFKNK